MVLCFITGEKKKTKVIDNNLDPEWNEVKFVCLCMCAWDNHYMYLITYQTLMWTLQASLSGSESLEVEVYDHEKLRSNRCVVTRGEITHVHSTFAPMLQTPYLMHVTYILVLETRVLHTVSALSRLLGTLSVSLQEVVSRGSQSLSSALKSKKGDLMQVE